MAAILLYRYDTRDSNLRITNQASRRYNKIGIILVLFFCAWQPLYAAIVLETPQTEVKVFVNDRKTERDNTPSTSLLLPLCTILVIAKHYGEGYLQITHTPLTNGVEEVFYQLFCEDLQVILPDVLSYKCNPYLPLTIPLTKLSVQLAEPLSMARSFYTSNVTVHFKLEA